jgi:hypothetical protein
MPNQTPTRGSDEPTESDDRDTGFESPFDTGFDGPTTPTIHEVEVSETISITVVSRLTSGEPASLKPENSFQS